MGFFGNANASFKNRIKCFQIYTKVVIKRCISFCNSKFLVKLSLCFIELRMPSVIQSFLLCLYFWNFTVFIGMYLLFACIIADSSIL